jgi:hypothetical protein
MEFPKGANIKAPKGCCLLLEVPFLVSSFYKSRIKGYFKVDNKAAED